MLAGISGSGLHAAPRLPRGQGSYRHQERLPAQVLAGLAAQGEGQRALLRTTAPSGSMLDLLLSLLHHPSSPAVASSAAAVLRNAALSPDAGTWLLARAGALQALVAALGEAAQQPARAALAAGALWALAYQSEKVRLCMHVSMWAWQD